MTIRREKLYYGGYMTRAYSNNGECMVNMAGERTDQEVYDRYIERLKENSVCPEHGRHKFTEQTSDGTLWCSCKAFTDQFKHRVFNTDRIYMYPLAIINGEF